MPNYKPRQATIVNTNNVQKCLDRIDSGIREQESFIANGCANELKRKAWVANTSTQIRKYI